MRYDASPTIWACDQQHTAVRVHVIHAALCVVLADKDCAVLPDGAMRQEVDDLTQRKIVVRDVRAAVGIAIADARAGGVVARQPDDDQ